jgi:hypothetical protein
MTKSLLSLLCAWLLLLPLQTRAQGQFANTALKVILTGAAGYGTYEVYLLITEDEESNDQIAVTSLPVKQLQDRASLLNTTAIQTVALDLPQDQATSIIDQLQLTEHTEQQDAITRSLLLEVNQQKPAVIQERTLKALSTSQLKGYSYQSPEGKAALKRFGLQEQITRPVPVQREEPVLWKSWLPLLKQYWWAAFILLFMLFNGLSRLFKL